MIPGVVVAATPADAKAIIVNLGLDDERWAILTPDTDLKALGATLMEGRVLTHSPELLAPRLMDEITDHVPAGLPVRVFTVREYPL